MNTLYDLFKVKEDATQAQIKQAYDNLLKKADSLPENEKIIEQVRRIKIAYGILSDPEKRKKYDSDLATQRADELLQKMQIKTEQPVEEKSSELEEREIKQEIENQIEQAIQFQSVRELKQKLDTQRQQKQLRQEKLEKQYKKQERKRKKQAKKDEELKREMQINAYGEYLQRQGYKVKYPWTWLRVKRLMISMIGVVIALLILWHIPFVRQTLTEIGRASCRERVWQLV